MLDVIVGEVQSPVESIRGNDILLKSGDNVIVRFHEKKMAWSRWRAMGFMPYKNYPQLALANFFSKLTILDMLDRFDYLK